MNREESSPNEVIALAFLVLFLFGLGFLFFKPHFATMQFAISRAEAKFVVSMPFIDNKSYIKRYSYQALKYVKENGIQKVDVEFSEGFMPRYYMIDKKGYKTDIPEKLYKLFFWYNCIIFDFFISLMLFYLYRLYGKRIERYDIKKLGYKQELLYPEIGINKRKSNKTAEGEVFDVMDYLIPNVPNLNEYIDSSLRISLKLYSEGFITKGEEKLLEFRNYMKKLEWLRLKGVNYFEKELKDNMLYKHLNGNYKLFKELIVDFNKQKNDNVEMDFNKYLQVKGYPTIGSMEELELLNKWSKIKEINFIYIGELYINMVPTDSKKGYYPLEINFDMDIDGMKIIAEECGYDEGNVHRNYKNARDKVDAMIDESDNRGSEVIENLQKQRYENIDQEFAEYVAERNKYKFKYDEDLKDYIIYKKLYLKSTTPNLKNRLKPLPSVSDFNDMINKKEGAKLTKEQFDKICEGYAYKDDMQDQYGRIKPLPTYILTPIRAGSPQTAFKTKSGKWLFNSVAGNTFLSVLLERILFSFEKEVAKTIEMMDGELKSLSDSPADEDMVRKLQAETKKMIDSNNSASRRQRINELLAIHKYEETFLMGLLEYGRTILNLPVGALSAHTKRINPALWYAITSIGRTYTYNVAAPISIMYEYEKRNKDKYLERLNLKRVEADSNSIERDESISDMTIRNKELTPSNEGVTKKKYATEKLIKVGNEYIFNPEFKKERERQAMIEREVERELAGYRY